MRKAILIVPFGLLACATSDRVVVGVDQVPEGSKCEQTAILNTFVGQPASPQLGAQIMAAARAPKLRWVPHGAIITMEYSAQRVTVRLDPQSRVASVTCG